MRFLGERSGKADTITQRTRNAFLLPVLAFSTVAATEENQGFLHASHSLPSRMRHVLLFLVTYWSV
jgi:hypothetical protein